MRLFTWLTRPHRLAVLVILLVHTVLSAFYSFNTPLWESYDETGRYAYAAVMRGYRELFAAVFAGRPAAEPELRTARQP